jgi:SAM-dependent methyltransferase
MGERNKDIDYNNLFVPLAYLRKISPFLSGSHIDYGCGNGKLTHIMHFLTGLTKITGYDISDEKVINARKKFQDDKVIFLSKAELRRESIFDSASLHFVFHETGYAILEDVYHILKNGGRLSVLDYDLKHIKSMDEFCNVFTSSPERKDIEMHGVKNAFLLHTSYGLEECVLSGERQGFKTVAKEKLYNKYFVWIAEKQ